jgi:hypothetical protein
MSNCTASQRTVTVSIVNFDVSDNGDAVLSSTGCIDRNCDTIGIYLKTRGKNPTRAILDNAFPNDILRAICWQESRWRHFASNGKPISHLNNDGTTDWGMMQINEATFEQQWNWKLNLARATDLLAEKHTQAVSYLNKHPKDVTPIMIENEMIQRYNFGPYYKWNPNTQTWEVSPPTNNNYLSLIRGFMNSKPW